MPLTSNRKTITIYTPYRGSYIRSVIEDCIIRKDLDLIFKSNGVLPLDTIKLYIPIDNNYISDSKYYGVGWTIKAGQDRNASYITEGICSFDFSSYKEKDMEEALRRFEREVNYSRPLSIEEYSIEGGSLNHLEVIC